MASAVEGNHVVKTIPIEGDILQRLHKVELEILLEVTDFCQKYGIRYFLSSGTLLGAVRHRGFIPWDDDVDISMPRRDFERFLSLAKELPEGYTCQATRLNQQYPIPIAKVRKNGTVMKEPAMAHLHMNHGIWIDVFPIDKVARVDKLDRRAHGIQLLTTAINYKLKVSKPMKMRTILACGCLSLLGVRLLDFWRTRLMMWEESCDVDLYTNFASNLGCRRLLFPGEVLFPLQKMEFEGYFFCVPAQPEKWLESAYDDYMTLPPKAEQVNRHKVVELLL